MGLFSEYHGPADAIDLDLAAERQAKRDVLAGRNGLLNPLCGDVVIFPTGDRLRISYVWTDGRSNSIQTSSAGRWYWLEGGDMDFSGALYDGISAASLTETGEYDSVPAWIFNHNRASAHRSVDVTARVLVWTTTAAVPS